MMADKAFDWLNPFASIDLGLSKHADGIKQWAISNRDLIQPTKRFLESLIVKVEAGLQAVPQGQNDTARALGLNAWQVQRHVILPQALRAALPALTNSFIAIFKDVSLVTVVSLYELTGSLSLALAGDADWRPYFLEGYLFIGAIYWIGCFALSRYSQRLEARLTLS